MRGREYSDRKNHRGILPFPSFRSFFLSLLALLLVFPAIKAQDKEYYEISVNLEVKRIGATEIEAVIRDKDIYLSINQLFNFLKINNSLSSDIESVSGVFIDRSQNYNISRNKNTIEFGSETIQLPEGDLIQTEFDLYLKSTHFGSVFGLDCIFNFRALSVIVETQVDLPLIREMRQQEIRKNLKRITDEQEADTTYLREYPMFKFGTADWSVISSQVIEGDSDLRLNLNLGAMIAGGEANASLYYDSRIPLSEKQQYYQWRYVNNDQALLRQLKLGKIRTGAVSTIYNPVVGVQVTNTPTTFRRSFGTYKISDRTEPGWIVELYVNNVLVDYVSADASGFYTFDVPLIYGNTSIRLKFYSPWGEENSEEQNINIPYNFLPKKDLEYTLSAGFIEDSTFSKFSRVEVNYGLSNRLTIGAGMEYVGYIKNRPAMPFASTSLRLSNNMMLRGEYIYGIRTGGALSWRLPLNIMLDLKYYDYEENQEAISYNYLEERKASLSVPLRLKGFSAYNRFSINQLILPSSSYINGEWMVATSFGPLSANLSTFGIFIENTDPYFYNNLALSVRLPARITLMPQAQYSPTSREILSAKIRMEKRILDRAHMSLSYERDFRSGINMTELGFRYNFSFARTGFTARHSRSAIALVEYARGSLIKDSYSGYRIADNRPNIGRGGIIVKAYLDYNANGIRDRGEPAAPGLKLRANGGRVDRSEQDTTIAILGLEPYTSCYIELDPNSFDNIAWTLDYNSISVEVDPNVIKTVNIPVKVLGEASGFIRIRKEGEEDRGLGRVIVNFISNDGLQLASTLSEQDGYYGYFGLIPGSYYAMPDTAQLKRLGMQSTPDSIAFSISADIEGDLIRDLDFLISMQENTDSNAIDTSQISLEPPRKPVTRKDTAYLIIHELVEESMTITEDSWAIQLGAFSVKSNAERLKARLEGLLGKDAEIVIEGGFHKVRILEIPNREEVDGHLQVLNENGFNEFWVIQLKAMQQQIVMRERTDTLTTIFETVIDPESPDAIRQMSIKIGSFSSLERAESILSRLTSTMDKELHILLEDNRYRIVARDFESPEELDRTMISMGIQGIRNIEISRDDVIPLPEITVPADTILIDTVSVVDTIPEIVERVAADSLEGREALLEQRNIETDLKKEDLNVQEPKISLLVGSFPKRTQALRAKRKIESKLNLPVEIIEQWDLYRVVVKGFFTPEETYRWYPELAGLGYDVISLIDER